jgi:thermolabile hemolysin
MKRFSIACGLIIASSLFPVRAIAATFSQIVVYGDSLSDLGRAAAATSSLPAQFKFPAYSSGSGRFSNGPIWIEYLAAQLGIDTNPVTNPNFAATNFAIGGATTGTVNIGQALSPSFIGIQQQVANNSISDPAALYVIWGGANDYVFATPTNPPNPSLTLANLTGEINTLISHGATNILVPNLPNLGSLPGTDDDLATSLGLNALTQVHNTNLETIINTLGRSNSGVKLTLLDVNKLFNQAVTTPSSFGFTDVTNPCITSPTCADPNAFLFWDDIHPTTAGHQLIGNLAFGVVSPTAVPEPMTILGSIVAFSSAVALKRKLKISKLKDRELVESI